MSTNSVKSFFKIDRQNSYMVSKKRALLTLIMCSKASVQPISVLNATWCKAISWDFSQKQFGRVATIFSRTLLKHGSNEIGLYSEILNDFGMGMMVSVFELYGIIPKLNTLLYIISKRCLAVVLGF